MIELPDTNGLSMGRAAKAYIDAGIPIVPFNPARGKVCGNLLGNASDDQDNWYHHVSTDRAVIDSWRRKFGPFRQLGLATSPGAFGAIVLDVDKPDDFPRDWRSLLETAPFTQTRPDEHLKRGHYWFMLPASHPPVGNPKHPWGEVRSTGGGLVLAPFPNDARHVVRSGPLPEISAELLSLVAVGRCGSRGSRGTPSVEEFCKRHTGAKYADKPQVGEGKLNGQITIHKQKLAAGMNEHDAMVYMLRMGLGEAERGFVSAKAVLDTFRARWNRSDREFQDIARWTVAIIEGSSEQARAEFEAMSRRDKRSDSREYAHFYR